MKQKHVILAIALVVMLSLFAIVTSAESALTLRGTMAVVNDQTLGPITVEGDATLNIAAGATLDLGTNNITVPSGATLTIIGEGTVTSSSSATVAVEKGGALILEGGTVENTATDGNSIDVYGTFTMTDGKAISTLYDSVNIRAGGNGNISGGEIVAGGGQGIKVLSSSLEGAAGTLTVSGNATVTGLEAAIIDYASTGNPRPVITLKGGTYIRTGGDEAYESYKYVLHSSSGRATWKIYKATLINDASTKWGNYNTVGDFFNTSGTSNGDGTYTLEASATYYDLWVGGVQVNNVDKNDIFGDGTVSYNVNTNTLYLNDANITTLNYDLDDYYGATLNYAEEESVIFSALPSLTIRYYGTNVLGGDIGTYADEGTATVTLTGPDVTDTLTVGAVEADALIVDGKGTVTATSAAGGANYCGVYAVDITVKDGAVLIASSEYEYTPTAMGFGTMNAEGYIATDENGDVLTIVDLMGSAYLYVKGDSLADDFSNIASYVKLAPVPAFYVQVGGVQVTDDNAGDILGDGKASFDAATNTLTISGDISTSDYGVEVVNYTGTDTLNILVTENAAFTTVQSSVIDALDGKIKLTIADGKTLSLTAGTYAIRAKGIEIVGGNLFATTTLDAGYYVIIGTDDGILIKDSNVEATSSVSAVRCLAAYENGDIVIDNSTVKAIANGSSGTGGSYGIFVYAESYGKLIVKNGSKVYATGASGGVYVRSSVEAEGFTITASTTAEADETACTETPTLSNNYYYIGEEKAKTVVIATPPHTHYICGEETCAGHPDGTTHSQTVTFDKALTMTADGVLYINGVEQTTSSNNTYTLSSGNYYLTADCAKASDLDKYRYIEIPAGAVVNLCLCDSTFSVYDLTVKGTLNLCSCGADGNIDGTRHAGIRANGGTVNVYGGTVVGNNGALEVKNGGTATVYGGSLTSVGSYAVNVSQAKLTVYDGSFTTTSTSLKQGALSITAAGTATDVDILGGSFTSTNDVILLTDNHYSAAGDHTSVLQISGGTFRTTSTEHKVLNVTTYGDNTPYCDITGKNVLASGIAWANESGASADPMAAQYAKVVDASTIPSVDVDELAAKVEKLEKDLADAKTALQAAIDTKASSEELTKAIEDLTAAYKAADEELKALLQAEIDADVKALKDALEAQLADTDKALEEAIAKAEKDLADAKTELQTAIDTKASSEELTKAIEDLTAAYKAADTALEAALETKIETDISTLQTALEGQITTVAENIAKVEKDLADAKTALQAAIDTKASSEELTKAIETLTAAYKAADEELKALLQAEIDADVELLKNSLEARLADTDKALEEAIAKAEKDLADAKTELQAAIDTKASSEELTKAIETLTAAYKAADTALEAALETKIETDISTLQTALEGQITTVAENIAKVEKDLADAKTALQAAIDTKASSEELTKAIEDLTAAYKAADEELKALLQAEIDADVELLKNSLEAQLADTDKALEEAIAKAEKDLADAKTELQGKLDEKASSEDLAKAVENLTASYTAANGAISALVDTQLNNLQKKLEGQLDDADVLLQSAVDALKEKLDKAIADLDKAIADGDTALGDKIAALDEAYKAADAVLTSAINADIEALKAEMATADGKLKEAIDVLQTALDALAEKTARQDKSLSDQILVVIIVLAITDAVVIAGIVMLVIRRKKVK